MKTQIFADVLLAHARSIGLAGDDDAVQAIRSIATTLLQIGGTSALGALLKKIARRRSTDQSTGDVNGNNSGLTMGEAIAHLAALQTTLAVSGAKAASADVAAFVDFMKPYARRSVVSAVSELTQLAADPPTSTKKSAVEEIDVSMVRKLADKLARANEVPRDFNSLVAAMKSDKKLSKSLMAQVANQFLGVQLKYKSKADIFKKIEDRHYVDTLNESRGRIIDSIAI